MKSPIYTLSSRLASSFWTSILCFLALFCIADALAEDNNQTHTFKFNAELGVLLSGGNTDKTSINFEEKAEYRFYRNKLTLPAKFIYGTSKDQLDARSWQIGLRYDRSLNERLSLFLQNLWEGDKFANIEYRINVDIGAQYTFIKVDPKNYLLGELGYRYRDEHRTTGDVFIGHIARVYAEGSKSILEGTSVKLRVEALPDLKETKNFMMNFELSLQNAMNEHFALKVAYEGKYDKLPDTGLQKYDYTYTTSLVANY